SFLDKANVSEQGMLEFFQKLENQELLPPDRQMEYVQTHPLTRDRIDAVRQHLQTSSSKNLKLDPKFYTMHERMKAKLMGFLQPETALLRYTDKDPRITARYARAIALYQTNQMDRAVGIIDGMIKEEPNNPFFQELKGQILFENGKVIESIPYYKKANDLLSDSALLHEAYGHALLETKDNSKLDLAIQQLLESNRLEGRVPTTCRCLAAAWGRKAELTKDKQYDGMVSYALAEEAVAKGADKEASQFAERAMKALPKGTAYWLRAQDIKLTTGPDADNPRDNDKDSKKQKP
ncbi:MAG: M48 family peptidase, partial [Alphaproteobacteria bacterium]